jgi:predicted dienelactone hydrolase
MPATKIRKNGSSLNRQRIAHTALIAGLSLLLQITAPAHLATQCAFAKTVDKAETRGGKDTADSSALSLGVIEDASLDDPTRAKKLPLKITYPEGKGKFPLIVFSHGAGGSKDSYGPLINFWASHGYVCMQPTHADSFRLRKEQGEQVTMLLRPIDLEHGWIDRILDAKLVLDSLDKLQKTYPELSGKIDKTKIGMGGHSFGALTSEIMCGAQVFDTKVDGKTIHDGRPRAVLLLSPAGVEEQPKLTTDSWNQMKIPMMVMTGTNDKGRSGQDSSWRTQPYLYSPPGSKYLIFINGGNHMIFSGNPDDGKKLRKALGSGPLVSNLVGADLSSKEYDRMFGEVKLASIKFWDDFLKGDKTAKAYLDQGGLATDSGELAKVEHR